MSCDSKKAAYSNYLKSVQIFNNYVEKSSVFSNLVNWGPPIVVIGIINSMINYSESGRKITSLVDKLLAMYTFVAVASGDYDDIAAQQKVFDAKEAWEKESCNANCSKNDCTACSGSGTSGGGSSNSGSGGASGITMPNNHVDWLTAQTTHQRRDPVALDLDGDGVEFIRKGTHFDYDNNSFAELSSRLSADDGWLVRDVNGDGAINNGAELFGDATVLKDGSLSPDGFTALSEYDTNKDGIISASEAAAANIKVWRDINGDSVSDAGELFAFDQLGISQLNLKNTAASNAEQGVGGETLRQTGTYQKTDGSFGAMNGYFLEQVTYDTIAADSTEVVPHW